MCVSVDSVDVENCTFLYIDYIRKLVNNGLISFILELKTLLNQLI